MPEITSDKELPELLNTPAKRVKWAEKLAGKHLDATATHARQIEVQFRTEPLDLDPFNIAKGALGPYVPSGRALDDEELESEGAWAYSFAHIPGKLWHYGVAGKGADGRIAVSKSLGCVFSKGFLAEASDKAVSTKVEPPYNL